MVCSNVPHYWVLGGYGWVHGAEITKQRQLLTNTKHDKLIKFLFLYMYNNHHHSVTITHWIIAQRELRCDVSL